MGNLFIAVMLAATPASGNINTIGNAMNAMNQSGGSEAVPIGDPNGWIRAEDYPTTAAQDGDQGSTAYQLAIDPKGRVSECLVTISSGSGSLDDATCNIITQRAIFKPTLDRRGRPTMGRYSGRVNWQLSDTEPTPAAFSSRQSFIVETDGSVTDCKIIAQGPNARQIEDIVRACNAKRYEPYHDDMGQLVRRRYTLTAEGKVEPVE